MWYDNEREISELIGKTLTEIESNHEEVLFHTSDGHKYKMYHEQDCCESVELEEVIGEFDDLIGSPITMAEVESNENIDEKNDSSHTWTFYKLATNKGYVTLRWLGESNGYYSETVDFVIVED